MCFNEAAKILFLTPNEEKPEAIIKFANGILRKLLQLCSDQLSANSMCKWIVGNKLSIADFALASLTFNIIKNENGPFADICG